MKLGRLTLTRCTLDLFESARLKTDIALAKRPQKDDLALVALALTTEGHQIPGRSPGQSFEDYSRGMTGLWAMRSGADPATIQLVANQAAQALDDGSITMEALNEARDFFGLPRLSPEPDSASGTSGETLSEESTPPTN